MSERWTLNAPIDVVWTPEDLAKICNAVRAMQAELRKFTVHVDVELNGVSILPPPEFDVAAERARRMASSRGEGPVPADELEKQLKRRPL